jgi:hypothetical protein
MILSAERESYSKSLDLEDFVSESRVIVQDYRCPLCEGIYMNPVVDLCGHVYCKTCILKYMETSKTCPISGWALGEGNVNRLIIINDILMKQPVQCKNRNFHCEWIGLLVDLEPHLNSMCKKQIVKCPHLGCSAEIFREDLDGHKNACEYRIIQCPDCEVNTAFIEIPSHQDVCPKFKLHCPQNCSLMVERKDVESHIREHCDNTVINCPYFEYGCQSTMTKIELEGYTNANMTKHNLLILSWMKNYRVEITAKAEMIEKFSINIEERFKSLEQTILNSNKENSLSIQKNIKKKLNEGSPVKEKIISVNNNGVVSTSHVGDRLISKKRLRAEEENQQKSEKMEIIDCSEDEKDVKIDSALNSPLYSVHLATPDGMKKKDHIFDMNNISKGIQIYNNRATCLNNTKAEHRFVFANIVLNDKEIEWRIILNTTSTWVGLGICIKDQVISNKFRFVSSGSNFNHAFFGISINGYQWNANIQTENNCFLSFPQPAKGDMIVFKYSAEFKELHYKIPNKYAGKISNVYAAKGGILTPCIIFLNAGDEVLFETI